MINKQQVIRLVALGCFGLGIAVNDGKFTEVKAAIVEHEQHEIIDNSKQDELLAQNPQTADNNKYFTGVLQSCNLAGSTVICTLVVKSKADQNMTFKCQWDNVTKLYDQYGNTYLCNQIQVGNAKGEDSAKTRFPQGTPIKVILTFNNIPPQISNFDTFEVHTSGFHFLRFNNVTVTQ